MKALRTWTVGHQWTRMVFETVEARTKTEALRLAKERDVIPLGVGSSSRSSYMVHTEERTR